MAAVKRIKSVEEFLDFKGNSSSLNVLKVGAEWCRPCKVLEGTLMELTDDEVTGVRLAEVDADEEWFDDEAAKLKVRGIPTLIAFKDGEEVDRNVGIMTRADLLEFFGRNK